MNYSECDQIIKYLDKEDLVKLRSYVENRREAYYYSEARKIFDKYLKAPFGFYNIVDGKLLFTDGYSIYLLNDSGILTQKFLDRLNKQSIDDYESYSDKLFDYFSHFESLENDNVGKIDTLDYKRYEVFNSDGSYSHFVNKNYYNNGEIFLGENTSYRVVKEESAFLLESPKGKGLVLGCKNHKRQ